MTPLLLDGCVVTLPQGDVSGSAGAERLTELEIALLSYLAARPGQAVSREELHREVWGYSERVRSRAVDFTMNRLRRKVERDAANPRHLLTVRNQGYRFVPGEAPSGAADVALRTPTGRAGALADVDARLGAGARLVTVHGLGGMGKTVVLEAVAAARNVRVVSAGGAGGDVRARLREAFTLPADGDDASLVRAVVARADPVVAIDDVTVEHGPFLGALAAGGATVVAAGRLALGVAGEHTVALGPLDDAAAIAVLTARLTEVRGPPGADEAPSVATLARRLGGWPLALELAASRARTVPLARLAERLDPLSLRDGAGRALDPILSEAWASLDEPMREALARLADFPGDPSLDAAEVVLADLPVFDVLDALCVRSLVQADVLDRAGRVSVPQPVRAAVRAHRPGSEGWRHTRLAWAADEAERVAKHLAAGRAWKDDLDRERGTVRAVWDARAGATRDGARLGIALLSWRVLRDGWQGLDQVAETVLSDARAAAGAFDAPLVKAAEVERANVLRLVGRYADALAACDAIDDPPPAVAFVRGATLRRAGRTAEARAVLTATTATADAVTAGRADTVLALLLDEAGDSAAAEHHARSALARLLGADARLHEAAARVNLAVVLRHAGRYEAARHELVEAERAIPASGSVRLKATVLHERAQVEIDAGCLDAGEALALQELELLHRFGDRANSAWPLSNLGVVAIEQGRYGLAAERLAAARAIHVACGSRPGVVAADANLGILALVEGDRARAEQALSSALAEAEALGITRHQGALRAFLAIARGTPRRRSGNASSPDGAMSAQDVRLLARLGWS